MERHKTINNTYLDAGIAGADTGTPSIYSATSPVDGGTEFYDLTIAASTATTFTVRATPKNGQAGDGFLNLLSTGQRQWDKDDSGGIGTGETDWQK